MKAYCPSAPAHQGASILTLLHVPLLLEQLIGCILQFLGMMNILGLPCEGWAWIFFLQFMLTAPKSWSPLCLEI